MAGYATINNKAKPAHFHMKISVSPAEGGATWPHRLAAPAWSVLWTKVKDVVVTRRKKQENLKLVLDATFLCDIKEVESPST